MKIAEKILMSILDFAYFVVLSLLFLPAFFIVTYLEEPWNKMLKEVFHL